MKNLKVPVLLLGCLAIAASAAVARDLKLPFGSGSKSVAGSGNAGALQTGVVQRYVLASTSISTALLELANAYGLKENAAALQAEITALQSGSVNDKDGLKKNAKVSDAALSAVQTKIESGEELTAEGRKHYIASLPHYITGIQLTRMLPDDARQFSDAAQSQLSSASMLEKPRVMSSLSTGTYLVGEIPGYTGRVFTGFKQIVAYAQKNQIPVPKDATAMLD
jgi:hypothetical protein